MSKHMYALIRSRRRSLALVISSDATLMVRAPLRMRQEDIDRIISKKAAWIERHMTRMRSRPRAGNKEFCHGETFLLLGGTYPLRVEHYAVEDWRFFEDRFIARPDKKERMREASLAWYKKEANRVLCARTYELSETYNLSCGRVRISSAKTRWGSCSGRGDISLSWRLVMAPLWVIDYVIVHELVHREHHNHSRAFWERVYMVYPRYIEAKAFLTNHTHIYTL